MADLGIFQKEFEKLDLDLQVHAIMLIDICKEIARISNKKLDERKLIACAVLHDSKNREENHAAASAEYAKKFLKKENFSDKFIKDVFEAIYNHSDKPKVKDFTIACFYDADILCRFYALGVLRAWSHIKSDHKRDWKTLFKKYTKKQSLKRYLKEMEQKLQLQASKKLLQSKEKEYLFSHELLGDLLFE
jgi:Cft2 family RNA processing exonuclease